MTHLLRYISSGKSTVVTLGDEIEYARRYLACMKARFRENLRIAIDVPEACSDVRVPKLIIQPIIENAIKYGLAARPPWRIEDPGGDGPGDAAALDHQRDGQRARLPGGEAAGPARADRLPRGASTADASLAISGMGLANIATRLAIFYGSEAVCSAANRPEGGAVVTIGGTHEPKTNLVGSDR